VGGTAMLFDAEQVEQFYVGQTTEAVEIQPLPHPTKKDK